MSHTPHGIWATFLPIKSVSKSPTFVFLKQIFVAPQLWGNGNVLWKNKNQAWTNKNYSVIAQNTTFGHHCGYNCSFHVYPSDFIMPSACISSRCLRTILNDVQSLTWEVGTSIRQAKNRLLSVIVVSVSANNLKSLVMHTYYKETALHVGNSRHVGDNIILLVPTERVLQVLKFLPFAAGILLWVYSRSRYYCSSSSVIWFRYFKNNVSPMLLW